MVRKDDNKKITLLLVLYVDDGPVCSNDKKLLGQITAFLKTKLEVSIMDPSCFVGLEIYRDRKKRSMLVNQHFYKKVDNKI